MSPSKNNKEFGNFLCEEIHIADVVHSILSTHPLDRVLNWIDRNLKPEQVFETSTLQKWAEENDYYYVKRVES